MCKPETPRDGSEVCLKRCKDGSGKDGLGSLGRCRGELKGPWTMWAMWRAQRLLRLPVYGLAGADVGLT